MKAKGMVDTYNKLLLKDITDFAESKLKGTNFVLIEATLHLTEIVGDLGPEYVKLSLYKTDKSKSASKNAIESANCEVTLSDMIIDKFMLPCVIEEQIEKPTEKLKLYYNIKIEA